MIQEHVELAFDPSHVGEEIQRVFSDDLARTLWLGIKQGHVVSQYFNRAVLEMADEIRRVKTTQYLTPAALFQILATTGYPDEQVIGFGEYNFAEELLPFALGVKTITYEIKAK